MNMPTEERSKENHVEPWFGAMDLDEVTTSEVARFRASRGRGRPVVVGGPQVRDKIKELLAVRAPMGLTIAGSSIAVHRRPVLTLASLRSPFAPNVYVQVGPLWLLALGLAARRRVAVRVALFAVLWVVISEGKGDFPNSWIGFAIECAQHAAVMAACVLAVREQQRQASSSQTSTWRKNGRVISGP